MPCIEMTGPPTAWFCDSGKTVWYRTLAYAAGPGVPVEAIVKRLHEDIEEIRQRSEIIYWRSPPAIRYTHTDDAIPTKDEIASGQATMIIRCRLATYPEIPDSEWPGSRIDEGSAYAVIN